MALDLSDDALDALFTRAARPAAAGPAAAGPAAAAGAPRAMRAQSAAAPLLNADKRALLRRRWPETLSGGLTWTPNERWARRAAQVALFAAPLGPGLAGLLWLEHGDDDSEVAAGCVAGALAFVLVLAAQLAARRARGHSIGIAATSAAKSQPPLVAPVPYVMVLTMAALCAWICGAAAVLLRPGRIDGHAGGAGGEAVLLVLGWLGVLTSVHSLLAGRAPAQMSVFRLDVGPWHLPILARPVLLALLLVLALAETTATMLIFYVALALLPLLWLLGWLPPIDAFVSWAVEQFLILLLGGSAMASERRLFTMAAVSSAGWGLVTWCWDRDADPSTVGVALAAGFGALLAQDCVASWAALGRAALISVVLAVPLSVLLFHLEHPLDVDGDACLALDVLLWLVWAAGHVAAGLQLPVWLGGLWYNPLAGRAAVARWAGRLHQALIWLGPLLGVAVVALRLGPGSGSDVPLALRTLAVVRALRWPWQEPRRALLDLAVTSALVRGLPASSSWLRRLDFEMQLLIVAAAHIRLDDLLAKLRLMARAWAAALYMKKLRHRATAAILVASVLLLPLVLGMLGLSVALAAPLMPFFGLPVFLMAFPRPSARFWPHGAGQACASPDAQYYEQAQPAVEACLSRALRHGALGLVSAGDHLLLRFQNRFVWVHVLETGFQHVVVALKGLELQETSCHTLEANVVEDALQAAFDDARVVRRWRGAHLGQDFVPVLAGSLRVFSDTRNTLTGITDSAAFANNLQANVMSALVWELHRLGPDTYAPWLQQIPAWQRSALGQVTFPQRWFQYLQQQQQSASATHHTADSAVVAAATATEQELHMEELIDSLLTAEPAGPPLATRSVAAAPGDHVLKQLCAFGAGAVQDRLQAGKARSLCAMFQGKLGDWTQAAPPGLVRAVQRAVHLAAKLTVDQLVLGDGSLEDGEELLDSLLDLQRNWHLGPENDAAWQAAVVRRIPNLFAIDFDSADNVVRRY